MDMEQLFQILKESVSACHTVLSCEKRLKAQGFLPLSMEKEWKLEEMGKYYVKHRDSSLFAFTVGKDFDRDIPVRIAAAHTDFPGLYIKADPQMEQQGYLQLNVEVYVGAILNTWLDRPLSAAGKVAVRSDCVTRPDIRFVDLKEPFCTIPNLAIHMNREINKGVDLNRQTHMLPIIGLSGEEKAEGRFLKFLAEKVGVEPEDILDFDLQLYSVEEPMYVGMDREFISAPHLDNTTSVYAVLSGVCGEVSEHGVNLAAIFDHEEIGSRSAQGAASMQLYNLLEKIFKSIPMHADMNETIYGSMMLSVDVAHAVHPNYPGKADPVLKPLPGKGFCIKEACSQAYATDSRAIAVVQQICEEKKIPYQKYANRSDVPGGGTLGSIASAFLPIRIVDIGVPILAMHSSREIMGTADMKALKDVVYEFYRIS